MYIDVKACVRCSNNSLSPFIQSNVGLKQGCPAGPLLFSLFIDELESMLRLNGVKGFQLHPDLIEIFIIMFADDIVLMAVPLLVCRISYIF